MYYRVFGSNDSSVEPQAFLEYLHKQGFEVQTSFRGDAEGWFHADILLAGEDEPVKLERFLATEEGIRNELHTWIAWLETVDNPHQDRLIRHLVATRQVFILLQPPAEETSEPLVELCRIVCRYLARETEGIVQRDEGFFSADDDLLVKEN
jgi:hypothetical protein